MITSCTWPRFSPCWLLTLAPINLVAMNDCCWPPESELELEEVPPIAERLEELDELELVGSCPVDELGEVLLFCAIAVAAVSAQNSDVLSKTFFIMLFFSFFDDFNFR
jgi:hypothetical protein